ncbi:vacuolar protein sorting-associated protein 13C isoform X2 [Takifugu rubripes]|uniref:vacuolar protein sorting-associated protein 13C isoform X2 n=1 Tax=Takifugu rubripes TaxID=31033 RepID=UPI0011451F65|nr:vacuolar protein sorting-associated protein 13C isoform X2 [Takifugu rubripes]
MVFESLVSDLLNRFIGDYVENLDKSQLKIGIWGGNVVLENLKVKENALNEFDVPFMVKAGQIGKLTLKIPWKNLYNDAVVATLDGLYLLVLPGAARKYDAAKEEHFQQEAKQRELQRIEGALQMAARRASQTGELIFSLETVVYKKHHHGLKKYKKTQKCFKKLKRHDNRTEKLQEEKKDTFVEKLATQVIKNLQVKISSIHIRYEDDLSDPLHPICVGITLSEMSLQTTDENWKACILNEAAKIIYKLGCLECLCVYWNVNSPMFYKRSQEDILEALKCSISSKDKALPHYQYIFKPIFASAKMCINPNAELELKSPKASLNLEVQNIAIEMNKAQYLTMVEMLESIDYMVRNAPYRKFRPEVPVHTNCKLWWHYAFNGIMDVHIRRVSRMWSWSNIRQHRQNLKAYRTAYKTKLVSSGKVNQDTEQQIQDLEKVLDVFNITLARQQAQMEVIRSGQKVQSKKATGGQKHGGFFSSFFGRKSKKDEPEKEESKDKESLEDLLTAEEKEKLYTAIGYSGSSQNLALPKEYVALVITFQLLRTSVTIREQSDIPEILNVQMVDLSTKISQRPGAQAFRVEATLQHWYVTGLQQQGTVPSLIASVGEDSSSLLSVVFELNPEDSSADQMLRLYSQPVEIIYDTLTVNSLADFFKTEKGLDLEVLTTATLSKLEEIKEKTATGLSHIIETRKVLDLRIDLKPSYLLIPKSGFYSKTSDLIIIDFGSFQLNSVEQSAPFPSSSLEEIMDRAYDRFSIELRRVQLLYSQSGESWKSARLQRSSVQHILHPMDFTVQLGKCMVEKDARMPRFKVSGELPLMHIKISDQKIQNILNLVNSIPLPNVGSTSHTSTDKMPLLVHERSGVLGRHPIFLDAMETDSDISDKSIDEEHQQQTLEELTNLQFKFEVKEVLLELTRHLDQEKPVLSLSIYQLGAEGKGRSFDLSITSYLRRVTLDYCDAPGGSSRSLHLIRSSDQQGSNLLKVEFIKADPKGPSFQTVFCNTEQMLKVEFSSLNFLLHTEALLSTIKYLSSIFPSELATARNPDTKKQADKSDHGRSVFKAAKNGGVFSLKLYAMLGSFHVEVCDDHCNIADIKIQGIDASVLVQAKQMQVCARLRDVVVTDVNPNTIHRKAVSIVGEELFNFELSLFPGATEGDGYSNMSKVDGKVKMRLGCIQIIYLHKFLMSLLMFIDNFQIAKEALSTATAQAAERAASKVRGFAQKSFRLLMDIQLKAPLIIIPQSSSSHNAVLIDLGMITVGNSFSLLQAEGFSLPVVVEKMNVKLTQLKLSRTTLKQEGSQPDIQILQPINLQVLITRNLAASWYGKLPGVQVQGVLQSVSMNLGEEDLSVLMKILVENIGEGSSQHCIDAKRQMVQDKVEVTEKQLEVAESEDVLAATNGNVTENMIIILLDFKIKEALLTLKKFREQEEFPFLVFHVSHLGIDIKVRKFDMCATTYIKEVTMKSLEFKDQSGQPLCLISSSVEPGAELFKVQYLKADRSGPNFSSVYKNTEQMVNVSFNSLDLILHSEALLSTINFLSVALSSGNTDREIRPTTEDQMLATKSTTMPLPAQDNIINLKVMMSLGAFNIMVCEQNCNIADIKIQGINGSILMQGPQTQISARLRDFIVLNADSKSIHKKVVSIVGNEVFSFTMSLMPNATEGAAYTDTSKTDGRLKLNMSCIQVVYLHKFFMSLLNFTNSFQMAREALSAATAQAAEKAASSVRDFAQKSFRLSMDINLKAPLIIVPQSSVSQDALVMDLGLIKVGNSFSLLPIDGCPLPAIIDNLDIQLSQLKLSRTSVDQISGLPNELLEPVNLHLNIKRNLAASWNKKMVAVEVFGDLKPMKVELSQDDLMMLLKIPLENLGEASSLGHLSHKQDVSVHLQTSESSSTASAHVGKSSVSGDEEGDSLETMRFTVNIESLSLVLYGNDPKQPSEHQHQQNLRLAEFALHLLKTSGKLWTNGCVEVTTVLSTCTLDDLRAGMNRVTSRMIRQRDEESSEAMIDVTYRQNTEGRELVAVLQKLYLCASIEFLLAVTEFFVQALPKSDSMNKSSALSDKLSLRETSEPQTGSKTAAAVKTRVQAVVLDPEVVFVANLMKADAPALLASFQCDFTLQTEVDSSQIMRANLRELKVQACPFIRNKDDKTITTVLRPCSVVMETKSHVNQPLTGSVIVEEVIVKISPFMLNTVMTITAAMRAKTEQQKEEVKSNVGDLWSVLNINNCNYWFLGVEEATEVTESFQEASHCNEGENFSAQIKVFQVTLESGLGHQTVPLLLAESSFNGLAKNWSSLLQLRGDMTLEVNYFNELHAVWEPLIERVDNSKRRWNLELEVRTNPIQDKSPVHGDEFIILPEPRTAISICSTDTMNVTVSQCALTVFHNLTKAFSEAATSDFNFFLKEKAPFTIKNCLGIPLIVRHGANLRVMGSPALGRFHELTVDQSIDLEHTIFESSSRGKLSTLQRQESCLFNLTIVPTGYSEISNIAVDKPGRRLYNIRGPMLQEALSVLLQVDAADGNKVVTVRAPLQIINHFSMPFTIMKYCPTSRNLKSVGEAEPDTEFHITLDSYRCQLFVCPSGGLTGQFAPSSSCISWKEQVHCSSEVRSVLHCPSTISGLLPLTVSTLAVSDDLRHIASQGEEDWDPAYVIHLFPVVTLRNLLPYTVRYMMESSVDSYDLLEGSTADLLNARVTGEIVSLVLIKYQGRNWHGHIRIHQEMTEFFSVSLVCELDTNMTVDVSVHVMRTTSSVTLSLFSPYWIINKTSRVLQYKAENVNVKHPADYRDIILFSFRKKNLFSKSKLQLCISNSSWSDAFSLDTVGSYGCVQCPASNMDYLVGVSIRMSSFNLTRIVTMSPFFSLVNRSSFELEIGEVTKHSSTRWHYISSTECLPFWPENTSGKLCLRVVGSESSSKHFMFNRQDNGTLLSLDMVGGIIVDINITDFSTVIGFSDYYEGAAPALLVNHTPSVTVNYRQSGSNVAHELKPGEARLFAWDNPAGDRKLCWSCMVHSAELDLLKDELGQLTYDGLSQVHWVSFLDGRQRVLLFTEDLAVVTKARQAEDLEQFQQEVKVSLRNLGLSLINNSRRQEIAYIGITSSGVVWEMKPKNRWKPFSQKNINALEKAYQSQLSGEMGGGWVRLDTNLEVNFSGSTMMMRHPISCSVRRNFLPGIQVEFKQSDHQRSLRAQLHWLQVDNQLPGAIFPIVFHPVPPPKSIALDSEPKPFIDVSIITRFNKHSTVMQFKYFMALIQEMAVKIDQDFLAALLALFTPVTDTQADRQKSQLLNKDLELLQAELMEASLSDTLGLNFFEDFHISPIKLHLSLSLGSGEDSGQEAEAIQSLNLLLKSIGATLTDVDDLIFKLAFFEVKYQFYRQEKLMWAVVRHYSEQFLKQMYVLVLGLDVLGNPFGLIRGLSEGVEAFFYEPFQGAVQGPEEFAEGFVIGVRSLFGHTVGGAAGMVSRITGSVGKGLAAITMDKDFQQKRREEMNRPPKDFAESLAKGGKGLLKGVVGGVTGIVTKPVEGAKKEGASGFFKGIGKGLVGVVARPTGGIVDMASSTFQGIQRVAESTEEVTKLRPARLIKEDGIIRPYDPTESQGFDLFQRSQIKQLEGEVFRGHFPFAGHRKTNIMVTNRRILCVKEIDFVGHFNKEWECLLENLSQPMAVSGSELKIFFKEQKKLMLKRDDQESVRTLQLRDPHAAQRLKATILEAQLARQQHRMARQKSQRFLKMSNN